MRAFVAVLVALASAAPVLGHAAPDDPAPPGTLCLFDAPGACDLGSHRAFVPAGNGYAWNGRTTPAPTTAGIEVRWTWTDPAGLRHEGWERFDVRNGEPVGGSTRTATTVGGEPLPPLGVPYTVACRSTVVATDVAGGAGLVGCGHRHDRFTSAP